MYLSRFGVRRYKCLGDIDIPLTPIHVLIGENDSGKTSLLEAMRAFCDSSKQVLGRLFPEPWSGQELVLHGSNPASVEFMGEWGKSEAAGVEAPSDAGGLEYGFRVVFPKEGKACTKDRELCRSSGGMRELPNVGGDAQTAIKWWHEHDKVPDEWQDEFQRISSVLKPAPKYALEPQLMAIPAAISPERKFRMDADGFGLATLLDDILGHDAENFIRLRQEFCRHFPQFRSVQIKSEAAVQRQYHNGVVVQSGQAAGKGIHFEATTGQIVRAQQASDGAVLFLGLLALAYSPDPPNLLLLEEPENGIYPKRLEEAITLARRMVERTEGTPFPQIILSTHSPYALSFFKYEEVTFLSREPGKPDGPVRARPLRGAPHIEERLAGGEFYLGELWYNLSEEELFGEP